MAKVTNSDRLSIRAEAERFLATHGFSTPPLPPDQALAARDLKVAQLSLDDLLVKAHLPPEDQTIQAMLDSEERAVAFRRGLPSQKKNWGALHEVAHEFLPWQRELLYCCPLLWLPPGVQRQLEAEADLFAAEAFFFGREFHKRAFEGDLGLATAKELATNVYGTSIHATLRHYAEQCPVPACLLVWKPGIDSEAAEPSGELALHYYVKSRSFGWHIDPGQVADPDGAVARVFEDASLGVVSHEMVHVGRSGQEYVAQAESFSNSYNVFTLISQPVRRSVQPATSPRTRSR